MLDATDPRLDSAQRLKATEEAAQADVRLAFTLVRGMTYGLLRFVRERHGPDVLAEVMGQLANISMTILDEGCHGHDD